VTDAESRSTVPLLIAIDGLGAVGKSTVGQIVARRLGCRFVDTGEMYRALAWLALHRGIDTGDELSLSKLASEARVEIETSASGVHHSVTIDGLDVTAGIHSQEVEAEVSNVSRVAGVRKCLAAQQRTIAATGRLVMAGRDIGTVVLPRAHLKVFLVASVEERAKRRYSEKRGYTKVSYEETLAELKRRDAVDSTRDMSPTIPARDARIVDTEGLTPQEVADRILALAKEAS
jgi:cytidylate kinase